MKNWRIVRQSKAGFATFIVEAETAIKGEDGRVTLYDQAGDVIGKYLDADILGVIQCEECDEHE